MEINELKIKEIKATKYKIECPFCKQEIIGVNKSQILYNLEIHINAKHKEKNNE